MNEHPYYVYVGSMPTFEKHRHPDIEINYCISGSYKAKINKTTYDMKPGDIVLASPMSAHEILSAQEKNSKALVIVVGTTLLSEYFEYFRNLDSSSFIVHLDKDKDGMLCALLEETANLRDNPTDFSELELRGNLYKICALLLSKLSHGSNLEKLSKNLHSVSNIEKALEKIYHNYNEDLKVEEMAELCAYSASNFCKVFKKITGTTFHNFLNDHRVQVACDLLKETNVSVESIAYTVGFANTKTLCRVFKSIMNCSPGQYRKKHLQGNE